MGALLRVSVLLTVAVAWAASWAQDVPSRSERAEPVALEDAADPFRAPEPCETVAPAVRVEIATGEEKWAAVPADAVPGDGEWIPLDLVTVDAETGGPAGTARAAVVAESMPPHPKEGEPAPTVWRSGTHVRQGDRVRLGPSIAAAPGHVPDCEGSYRAVAYVSRRAERVRLTAPLRREADVRVRVIDAGGGAVGGARVKEVVLGGPEPRISHDGPVEEIVPDGEVLLGPGPVVPCRADPTDDTGWTQVHGIPHLLDERFWITAGTRDHESYTELTLGPFGSSHAAEIRLPAKPSWVLAANAGIGLGGGAGSGRRGRYPRWVPARLEAVVFRADGSPAAGMAAFLGGTSGVTDPWGRVVFEGVRPGEHAFEVRDPDFVWSKVPVTLGDGESRAIEFVEPPGWTARATLLDSVGRRVPFARVRMGWTMPVEYVRVVNGVQDLVLYTNANGEIEMPRMHHGPVRLTFRYGSRSASVTLEEGDPYATVRLPRPR